MTQVLEWAPKEMELGTYGVFNALIFYQNFPHLIHSSLHGIELKVHTYMPIGLKQRKVSILYFKFNINKFYINMYHKNYTKFSHSLIISFWEVQIGGRPKNIRGGTALL